MNYCNDIHGELCGSSFSYVMDLGMDMENGEGIGDEM